jgi:hypothetical protein
LEVESQSCRKVICKREYIPFDATRNDAEYRERNGRHAHCTQGIFAFCLAGRLQQIGVTLGTDSLSDKIDLTRAAALGTYNGRAIPDRYHRRARRTVTVQAIGEKRGNRLLIQGQEFTEHESD